MQPGILQRELRKSLGLKQIAVAKAAKIHVSRLSLIENGWVTPRQDEIHKIKTAVKQLVNESKDE